MLRAIKIRLYPNKKQIIMLNKHFGCSRFIYNAALNYKTYIYNNYNKHVTKIDIINQLPDLKKEYEFLKEVKAETLQNTITNLDYAFNNFYKSGKGFPKFKNKHSHNSFTQNQNFIINESHLIFLSESLKYKCSERDKQKINNTKIKKITYSKNNINHYFASILIDDCEIQPKNKVDKKIGIDLGISNFIVTSEQEFIKNPLFLNKSLKKVKVLQQKLSKKTKQSNNYNKARLKLAKVHNKIQNQREYFLHTLSSKLINENQVIYIEDLNITGMLKEHKLAKNISDSSWYRFTSFLEYKAKWYGREVKKIDRYYPSSKTCSRCGNIKINLTLEDRIYKCDKCGLEIDRDYNASLNILTVGKNYPESSLIDDMLVEVTSDCNGYQEIKMISL